jgi:hypothetical protein
MGSADWGTQSPRIVTICIVLFSMLLNGAHALETGDTTECKELLKGQYASHSVAWGVEGAPLKPWAAFERWLAEQPQVGQPLPVRLLNMTNVELERNFCADQLRPLPPVHVEPLSAVMIGEPDLQFVTTSGRQNAVGLRGAIEIVGLAGERIAMRPLASGVSAGERFRLHLFASARVIGTLALEKLKSDIGETDNRTPLGRIEYYPPIEDTAFMIEPATLTVIPADGSLRMQSPSDRRRLRLSLRDSGLPWFPTECGPVYRKNAETSSRYLQMTHPATPLCMRLDLSHTAQLR